MGNLPSNLLSCNSPNKELVFTTENTILEIIRSTNLNKHTFTDLKIELIKSSSINSSSKSNIIYISKLNTIFTDFFDKHNFAHLNLFEGIYELIEEQANKYHKNYIHVEALLIYLTPFLKNDPNNANSFTNSLVKISNEKTLYDYKRIIRAYMKYSTKTITKIIAQSTIEKKESDDMFIISEFFFSENKIDNYLNYIIPVSRDMHSVDLGWNEINKYIVKYSLYDVGVIRDSLIV